MNAMPAFSSRFGSCGSSVRTSIDGWFSSASISSAGDVVLGRARRGCRDAHGGVLHDLCRAAPAPTRSPTQRARRRRTASTRPSQHGRFGRSLVVAAPARRDARRPGASAADSTSRRPLAASSSAPASPGRTTACRRPPTRRSRMNTVSTVSVIAVEITNPLSRRRTQKSRGGDEPPRAAVGRALGVAHAPHHLAEQLRERRPHRPKCTTSPAPRARSSTRCSSTPSCELQHDAVGRRLRRARTPGIDVVPSVGRTARPARGEPPLPRDARSSSIVPCATMRPSIDQHDRVAEPLDQLELVAREHDGHAVARRLAPQHAGEHVDPDRVEPRERLVEDEHVGPVHERGGELHALLVAERERLDPVPRALRDPEHLERLGGPSAGVGRVEPVEPREVHELLVHAHLRVEAALLRHVPEAPARSRRRSDALPSHRRRRPPSSTPSAIRIVVVLPAPFGPTNPTISPSRTANDTPSSATTSSKRRRRSISSSMRAPSDRGTPAQLRVRSRERARAQVGALGTSTSDRPSRRARARRGRDGEVGARDRRPGAAASSDAS